MTDQIQEPSTTGPLTGLRVLELGNFIAGPFAGQLLGDYGAEILKIEPPNGDSMRNWGVTRDGGSLWWPTIARNKKSLSVDLRTTEGRDIVQRLAVECDVIIENFRPGRLASWGLDYASLAERNPRLVMVHVSGFGQTGPRASAAGFGSIGEAYGGIRHTTGEPDRPPSRAGVSLGDELAGMFAVIGALAAVNEMRLSGQGQEVDVAIYEAVAALMESSLADYELAGVERGRSGSILPGVAPSNAYPTADGAEVIIAGNADAVFARLCKAMGAAELAEDPRFVGHQDRGANMRELDELIGRWTAGLSADEVLTTLDDAGVPAGRIYTARDMLSDPHYLARGMVQRHVSEEGWEVPMSGVVPTFSRTPGGVAATGPRLGRHTREVLVDLGVVTPTEYDTLSERGVLGG
ncbi:MAG: CaiB/BaiF CoA transferase family protein [Marmoricola sp.]